MKMLANQPSRSSLLGLQKKIRKSILVSQGLIHYAFGPRKEVVCIVSAMRSGSTLLKALLGQASDVSHISEYDFSSLNDTNKYESYLRLNKISQERIIVLKRPRWFSDHYYPSLPPFNPKVIVLYRDVVGVVRSAIQVWPDKNIDELINYWILTYQSIQDNLCEVKDTNIYYVNYKDLVLNPKFITSQVLAFIGSQENCGFSTYNPPAQGDWEWDKDDGGNKIKRRMVQPESHLDEIALEILKTAEKRCDVNNIREKYLKKINKASMHNLLFWEK